MIKDRLPKSANVFEAPKYEGLLQMIVSFILELMASGEEAAAVVFFFGGGKHTGGFRRWLSENLTEKALRKQVPLG